MNKVCPQFGIVLTPLADLMDNEDPIPEIDYSDVPMVRCNRCGAFLNPNFSFKQNIYICNICFMENPVTSETTRGGEDVTHGVYDLIVPKQFHVKPLALPRILFCIEMNNISVEIGNNCII